MRIFSEGLGTAEEILAEQMRERRPEDSDAGLAEKIPPGKLLRLVIHVVLAIVATRGLI